MPVDRLLWEGVFSPNVIPPLPCPRCRTGRLKASEAVVPVEPQYSKNDHGNDDWEPEWIKERFVLVLTCENASCGEIVAVAGDTAVVQSYEDDPDYGGTVSLETVLRPRSMFPPPPLFPIPKAVPTNVAEHIRTAFQLYWTDLPSAASRLRTSLEVLLDEMNVPRTGVNKKSKVVTRDLSARIDAFQNMAADGDSAESMHALRVVGNLATHGDVISRDVFFDALDIYEDALLEVFERKSIKLKAKKLKLLALKPQK